MALFGDLGKALGLGTARQTMDAALQGALRGAVLGQPFMGGAAGALSAGRTQQGQSTAVATSGTPPRETAFSGETIPGNAQIYGPTFVPGASPASMIAPPLVPRADRQPVPAGLPAIVGGGVAVSRGFLGPFLTGAGAAMLAPTIIDPFTGQEKKLRVTRRLRSQVRRAVEMFGVDQVANQMGLDAEAIFYILTKKMRNDGPYVTKAAVRKTRQTVRKMKHLCDMYDDLRPPARRAPARRTTTSKVMQIKN